MGDRRVRPVDAAGLVLLRPGAGGLEVLLGRRHRRHAFLPDVYVFPGGRVDPQDSQPSGFAEPLDGGLVGELGRGARGRDPAAFLRAAIRETFEEAGLLVARGALVATPARGASVWQAYQMAGTTPAFDRIAYVCRAITPASSPRRYNTRFFLAEVGARTDEPAGNGELEDLRWCPVEETGQLGLVDVTQFVLEEALRRRGRGGNRPAPLLCYRNDTMRLLRRT